MSGLKTHRGFTLDPNGQRGYLDLPLIDTLYHHMETKANFEHDFDYVKDVVRAAKQVLFNRKGDFILAQQLNIPCSHWVFNFAVSTLAYIQGQPRKIELENYRDLLLFHPTDLVSVDGSRIVRENNFGWYFGVDAGKIIQRWLAQEDGLTDLVMSLNLIAGSLPPGWFHQTEARPPS